MVHWNDNSLYLQGQKKKKSENKPQTSGGVFTCTGQVAKEQWYLDEEFWNNLIIISGSLSIKGVAQPFWKAKEICVHRRVRTVINNNNSKKHWRMWAHSQTETDFFFLFFFFTWTMLILQQNWQRKPYFTHLKKSHHWRFVPLLCAFQNRKIDCFLSKPPSFPRDGPWLAWLAWPLLSADTETDKPGLSWVDLSQENGAKLQTPP